MDAVYTHMSVDMCGVCTRSCLLQPLSLWPLSTDETSFEAGIKVQIHTQDEPPFIDQLGFGVAPGFQTFVSCQEQRVGVHSPHRTYFRIHE